VSRENDIEDVRRVVWTSHHAISDGWDNYPLRFKGCLLDTRIHRLFEEAA
jgi:hypothetical protein